MSEEEQNLTNDFQFTHESKVQTCQTSELSCSEDPNISRQIKSSVPEICKTEPCILGIDEAGRGPALGPMVYGIAYAPISKEVEVEELGFADSKTLNEQQRDDLFDVIKENNQLFGWAVHILSPQLISSSMLRRKKYNLNMLSHDTAIGLVKLALRAGANIQQVRVDTVGDPKKYEAKLNAIFPNLDIMVRAKADSLFPIVSAASICAKVTRDHQIYNWKFADVDECKKSEEQFKKYGSGYPGDPNTKAWLANNVDPVFGFNSFVRFSWSTAKAIMESKCVPVDYNSLDVAEEEEATSSKTRKITDMFSKKSVRSSVDEYSSSHKRLRNKYFADRNLNPLKAL